MCIGADARKMTRGGSSRPVKTLPLLQYFLPPALLPDVPPALPDALPVAPPVALPDAPPVAPLVAPVVPPVVPPPDIPPDVPELLVDPAPVAPADPVVPAPVVALVVLPALPAIARSYVARASLRQVVLAAPVFSLHCVCASRKALSALAVSPIVPILLDDIAPVPVGACANAAKLTAPTTARSQGTNVFFIHSSIS